MSTKIELGHQIEDGITGFQGTVVGIVDYITGCKQILVQPRSKDGAWVESHWLDADRATVIPGSERSTVNVKDNGPDKPAPRI